jgi:integrase
MWCLPVDLPSDIPHVLRHSFASLAADLGLDTIASLLGHKTHSITQQVHALRRCRAGGRSDAVANAHHEADQAQPQLRDQHRDGSTVWDEFTSL